tara:strand:+ start:1495 stop:3048 length:1554 start_codon:yes stop_codon:yes gene_type:complete
VNFIRKYIFLLSLVLFSCAVKAPPSGGEQDTKSPYILDVFPSNGSINLSAKNNLEISFNEMIDPNSIKSSIEIYPDIEIKINRFGKKIIIKPKDEWPSNKTFKIKIKRGISDYFGNKLESGKVLTYSTSNKIFKGSINGEVFNSSSVDLSTIALYKIMNNELFYYASIENDKNNRFIFENIDNGEYIIIGIENDIDDIYNDVQKYNYGIHHKVIQLTNEKNIYDNINIMFSYPDYKDDIIYASSSNNFYGEVEFLTGNKVFLVNEVLNKSSYKNDGAYILYDNALDSIDVNYRMNNYIKEYFIKNKFKLNKALADSIPPKITESYFDNNDYVLKFSEPVYINDLTSPFYLINDEDTTFIKHSYLNPFTVFLNDIELTDNQIYINNTLITDYSDSKEPLEDSKLNLFSGLQNPIKNGGDISGNINYNGDNEIIVEIKNLSTNDFERLKIDKTGVFKFDKMKPGRYSIWAYEHINQVSDYYYNGVLKSLKLGARFGLYDSDIEVRANWDIEGIEFNINE